MGKWYDPRCGKVRHSSRVAATRQARALRRKTNGKNDTMVYLCAECGGWHVATQRPKRRRR